jgi:dienelactone hydrolase
MKKLLLALALVATSAPALAELKHRVIEYKDGDTVLEGYFAYDDALSATRPGVLLVHAWKGQDEYVRKRADMLAQMGYVAFAADIYGKGLRPQTNEEAAKVAGSFRAGDRALLRKRARLALEALKKQKETRPEMTAALGYCFGGGTVLELARDGADDAAVPPAQVAAFEQEMREAQADWQLVAYGNAVHSFTDWNAGTRQPGKNSAYNKEADERSWIALQSFLKELFR